MQWCLPSSEYGFNCISVWKHPTIPEESFPIDTHEMHDTFEHLILCFYQSLIQNATSCFTFNSRETKAEIQ